VKGLIVYGTRYGTSAECARRLGERLSGSADLADVRTAATIERRELVVIGGPIYGGKLLPAVSRYCDAHREALLSTTVGLFICCLYSGEAAEAELTSAFPPWLFAHARSRKVFGGSVHLKELRLIDRYLVRKVARVEGDIAAIDDSAIAAMAAELDSIG